MSRVIVALSLVMASTAASWAQGLSPSVWRSESGALLKVVRVDAGGAFSGVFPQQPDQSMSGRSLRYGRGRSRPSRRIPDVEKLDVRLQHKRGLVRALCQPDNHCRTMGRDRARPRGQGTRQRGFPPALNSIPRRPLFYPPGGWPWICFSISKLD